MGLKPQVYKDERPAEYFTRFHERTRRRRPDWVYKMVRTLLTPYLLVVHRARVIDSDKIPPEGPVIVAPNHFSFMDHFFTAAFMRREVLGCLLLLHENLTLAFPRPPAATLERAVPSVEPRLALVVGDPGLVAGPLVAQLGDL